MKIVYDYQVFSTQVYGGVSRYFFELASHVARLEDSDVSIVAPLYVNEYLREETGAKLIGVRVPALPRTGRLRLRANQVIAGELLRRAAPQIVHESEYAARPHIPRGARVVTTVHDMIRERFPEYFPSGEAAVQAKAEAVRSADHVLCVSDTTRRDLLERIDVDPAKVTVVHHGVSLSPANIREQPALVRGPYLLYVGQRRAYKNCRRFLQAVASVPQLRAGLRVVCFGGERLTSQEWEELRRIGWDSDSLLPMQGDDTVLANLYAHAEALVYPSLYEGFGLPALEAMALGCPVVCSSTGSLPEVVGSAAEQFDPTQPEDIAAAIERALVRAEELRSRGHARVREFTWERCATRTHACYQSLV